jgi:hypothetical protein
MKQHMLFSIQATLVVCHCDRHKIAKPGADFLSILRKNLSFLRIEARLYR